MNGGKVFNGTGWLFNSIKNYLHFLSFLPLYYTHCVRLISIFPHVAIEKCVKSRRNHCLEKSRKTKLLFTHQINQLDRIFPKSKKHDLHRKAFHSCIFPIQVSFQIIFYTHFGSRSHSLNCFCAHIAIFNNIILGLIAIIMKSKSTLFFECGDK